MFTMSARSQPPSLPHSPACERQAIVLRMAKLSVAADRIASELVNLHNRLRALDAPMRDDTPPDARSM